MEHQTRVGVGCIIQKDGKILLGFRLGKHSPGTWSPPGGHVEFKEHPADAAIRETLEETGLVVRSPNLVTVTSDYFPDNDSHYATIIYKARLTEGEPALTEPDRFKEWNWFGPDELPEPLFGSLKTAIADGVDLFS